MDVVVLVVVVLVPLLVFASAIVAMAIGARRVPAIRDPQRATIGATGAFMLVRRSAFARTPGFEWLKLEVADEKAHRRHPLVRGSLPDGAPEK